MKINKPLNAHIFQEGKIKVFLAGSIEQGKAVNWQEKIENELMSLEGYILNPRRDDWDDTWVQDISNENFKKQVEWELDGLEKADIIFLYFDPETKSPISLLEFGLYSKENKLIVYCPKGFWRKGNVDIVGKKYNVPIFEILDDAVEFLKTKINEFYTINIKKNKGEHENANYLFEELENHNFEQSFFERLPQLLTEEEMDLQKSKISLNDLEYIGDMLGVDWNVINKEELKRGVEIELEEHSDAFGNNIIMAAKITLGHLKQMPDYYKRMEFIEQENFWDKVDNLYNEYSENNEKPSILKNNIILFVLSNIRSFRDKHYDVLMLLPESATKRLIKDCMVAGLVGSKIMFKDNEEDFNKTIINIYNELIRDLNLKLDNSQEIVYNDIDDVLKPNMIKAMNLGKYAAWKDNVDKEKYIYLAKSSESSFIFEFDDLQYLINTNGHLFDIQRLMKGS